MGEKLHDLGFCHFAWVTFGVEENEAPDPIEVGLLSAQAVAASPHEATHLLNKFWLAIGWLMLCHRVGNCHAA